MAAAPFHCALLRGINVGGKNMVPMKALAAMFAAAGCDEVRTYIASGNVLFRARAPLARKIPTLITAAIQVELGLTVPVVLRSAEELRVVVSTNPFLKLGRSPEALHVAFMAVLPSPAQVASLDPDRSPGDEFRVQGREIYLHCPRGVGQTKLTNAYFDARLGTPCTGRNWRTVLALVEMMS